MRRASSLKVTQMRDDVLAEIDASIEMMPPTQAIEFLDNLMDDLRNLVNGEEDKITNAKAATACTCSKRGRDGIHTKACAKTKAIK
jgi:hypothetical protein